MVAREECGCKHNGTYWIFLCGPVSPENPKAQDHKRIVEETSARWKKERAELANFVPTVQRINGKIISGTPVEQNKPVEDPIDIIGSVV